MVGIGAAKLERFEARTLLSTLRIGSLGDSLTDEYEFYGPDRTAARNWVQILGNTRAAEVDFGAFTTMDRGETRNQGYAQDWARSGAQAVGPDVSGANTFFTQQYLGGFEPGAPGLINQPGGLSNVDVVTILIGANDFVNAIEQSVLMPMGNSLPATLFNNLLSATAGTISGVQARGGGDSGGQPGQADRAGGDSEHHGYGALRRADLDFAGGGQVGSG